MADNFYQNLFIGLGTGISLLSGYLFYKRFTSYRKYSSEKTQVMRHKQNSSMSSDPILTSLSQKNASSVVLIQNLLPHFKQKQFSFYSQQPHVKLNDGFKKGVNGKSFKSVAYQSQNGNQKAFQINCQIKNSSISQKVIHSKRRSACNQYDFQLDASTFARCSTLAVLGVAIPDGEKFKIQARFIGLDYTDIISFWERKLTRDFYLCLLSIIGLGIGGYMIYYNIKKRKPA